MIAEAEQYSKVILKFIEDNPSKVIELTEGGHKVTTPGTHVPKADANKAPSLALTGLSQSKTYIALGIDLDAPFPSFSFLGPILHWIQADLKVDTLSALTSTTAPISSWVPAAPPGISAEHRYVIVLYEQPEGFDPVKATPAGIPDGGLKARIRFDATKWVKETGLGEPVAANYFTSS